MKYLSLLLLTIPLSAESLRYNINWQSGLSLGEAELRSDQAVGSIKVVQDGKPKEAQPWQFALNIDAGVPGFALQDQYHSSASSKLCTVELNKNMTHGTRKSGEKLTFDPHENSVTRDTTSGGGTSTFQVSPCARDALTFLQFARSELAQGRLPSAESIVFGSVYQVRMEFAGSMTLPVGEKRTEADHFVVTVKGPASNVSGELFLAKDPTRTPILAKIPTALGTFTLELVR